MRPFSEATSPHANPTRNYAASRRRKLAHGADPGICVERRYCANGPIQLLSVSGAEIALSRMAGRSNFALYLYCEVQRRQAAYPRAGGVLFVSRNPNDSPFPSRYRVCLRQGNPASFLRMAARYWWQASPLPRTTSRDTHPCVALRL